MTLTPSDIEAIRERARSAYQIPGGGLWASRDVDSLLTYIAELELKVRTMENERIVRALKTPKEVKAHE